MGEGEKSREEKREEGREEKREDIHRVGRLLGLLYLSCFVFY